MTDLSPPTTVSPPSPRLTSLSHGGGCGCKIAPGVLSEINKVFSDKRINIAAQYLQTRGSVGYVVIDIEVGHSDLALAALAKVPGTIRSRILF